ncbi:hypothetical protein ACJX0J_026179, partial [Zea mays]
IFYPIDLVGVFIFIMTMSYPCSSNFTYTYASTVPTTCQIRDILVRASIDMYGDYGWTMVDCEIKCLGFTSWGGWNGYLLIRYLLTCFLLHIYFLKNEQDILHIILLDSFIHLHLLSFYFTLQTVISFSVFAHLGCLLTFVMVYCVPYVMRMLSICAVRS